jgi:TonB family protein
MAEFLIYDLKVAVLIAIFYFCYRLLMESETMHRLNRIVLLSSILLSLVLPLCVITLHKTIEVAPMRVVDHPELVITELGTLSTEESNIQSVETNRMGNVKNLLQPSVIFAVFIIGLLCRLLYIANSYRHLRRMIKDSELHSLEDGVTMAVVDLPVAPFSWMRTIVLSRIDYEERNPSIIAHERGHILLHHSWDIVFVEVLTALQWFNPVVWLLRRDLRTVHEYEADASVLSSGSDVSQYIQLLMRKATGTKACILANGINNSTTKKRINMMLVNKSPRRNSLKLLALLPIVGITVALNAETVTNMVYKNEEPQKQVPVKKGKKNATIKINANQGIQVVEAIKAPEAANKEKTYETTMNQEDEQNVAVIVYDSKPEDEKPMLIVDDNIATIEQVRALPRDSVVRMAVMRPDAAIKSYGSDAKNGVIIITTQRHQEEIDNELVMPDVFDRADEMPQFPDGHMGLMQYLANNIQYPKDAEEAGTQGRVIVSFIVEKDGSISNAKVTKPTYSSLDEEALRVVNAMPKWIPGKVNGKTEKIKYSVPINFRIDNTASPKAEVNELSMRVDGNNPKSVLMGTVNQVKIDNQDALNADIEIDGKKASIEELWRIQHSDIESMQLFEKDDQHPKVRLIITTKKNK